MQSIIQQNKIHFYEYVQIQTLQQYITKGVKYFINAITDTTPAFIRFRYYTDQITLLINCFKDLYCLVNYNSTYCESFYGLERAQQSFNPAGNSRNSNNNKTVSNKHKQFYIIWQIFVNTVIPYILSKLQKHYNILTQEQHNEGRQLSTIQTIFTKIYPYCYLVVKFLQTALKFRYLLFKQVQFYDIFYKLARVKLSYKKQLIEASQQSQQSANTVYPYQDLLKTPGLLMVLLGHKAITWYFSTKNQRERKKKKRVITKENDKMSKQMKDISPFDKDEQSQDNPKAATTTYKKCCMICAAQPIKNPTVIKQSGYVYCYECITRLLKQNSANPRCPMSSIDIDPDESLQLIYST